MIKSVYKSSRIEVAENFPSFLQAVLSLDGESVDVPDFIGNLHSREVINKWI